MCNISLNCQHRFANISWNNSLMEEVHFLIHLKTHLIKIKQKKLHCDECKIFSLFGAATIPNYSNRALDLQYFSFNYNAIQKRYIKVF